jgi:hypothetical protein
MLIRKILSALAAGLGLAVIAAPVLAATPASKIEADAAGFVIPNLYGKGIPMGFSALDGENPSSGAFVGLTREEPLAIQFQLPKEPVLRIHLPSGADEKIRYRAVTNDLIVATIPSDPVTVVMGFASGGVVVGRVPPGGRVSLQGGDMNCQIMRKDVGDRVQFAFAWDAKSGKAAADAALAAVGTSIDTLVEQRLEFFKRVAPAPDSAPPLAARTLAKAFSVMKLNVNSPEGRVKTRWVSAVRCPAPSLVVPEAAFSSIGLTQLDSAVARDALLGAYGLQGNEGFLPTRASLGKQDDEPAPPLVGWAAWNVYFRGKERNREFLQRSYDVASKNVTWYVNNRMLGENSGLFSAKAGGDLALDLTCQMAAECGTLQQMAQVLGFREDAKTWSERADGIAAAARKEFWNEEKGFFFGRKAPGGEAIPVWTVDGFLPLWAGVATKEQAARLVQHLKDPKKFWTAAPVPIVARDDPAAGSGPVRMQLTTNYLLYHGLHRAGYPKEAEELRQKTLGVIAKWYGRLAALSPAYDADDQASPAELEPVGSGQGEAAWPRDGASAAAIFADLLLRAKP